MRIIKIGLSVIVLFTFLCVELQAQGPAPPPAQNEVPLDGFSLLLIAAGVGYGANRFRENRKSI